MTGKYLIMVCSSKFSHSSYSSQLDTISTSNKMNVEELHIFKALVDMNTALSNDIQQIIHLIMTNKLCHFDMLTTIYMIGEHSENNGHNG